MTAQKNVPFGEWRSPITSDLIVAGSIGLGQLCLDGQDLYWSESRPTEGGRNVIMTQSATGDFVEITSPDFNVRTRVHEYGGGAYRVVNGVTYFINYRDQHLYRQAYPSAAVAVTTEENLRYADMIADRPRDRCIAIREDHRQSGQEAINTIVAIQADGTQTVLVSGHDFYASPTLSPDGTSLAWITWNHPNMPWDGTELWLGTFQTDGTLADLQCLAGSSEESIFQPQWGPDGQLYFVSDRLGWWNLYRWSPTTSEMTALFPKEAEFGQPQWVFGMSNYGFTSDRDLFCTYSEQGISHLAHLDLDTLVLTEIPTPYTNITGVQASPGLVAFLGGSTTEPTAIVRLDLVAQTMQVVRKSTELQVDPGYLSIPRPIEFPTSHGLTAHAFFYPPNNQDYQAPAGERPPLLVKSHGGPTAATTASFDLRIQYWTSRGFAVLDVNYGGSTGYGRAYRQRLNGNWGIVDVDDCANGAQYLADQGEVDGDRLVINGGSAGGYTTLCALTFRKVFKAGASYYGVSDLKVLAEDTHKFESRYLDSLIGPYPQEAALYYERSPINFVDQLSCPVVFFQGDEDKIVPPNQAERMVEALKQKGLPVAYVLFEGEQHGFRKAENIRRVLDGEFYFYSRVFGFQPAESIEPISIANLEG
ncbi:S9 family peptidase [Alkalinema pantanalense CENA528]|uniref:S9 family peptidase n=1 Tax=Alkalinema pantanalense TaxID=1620705 RepID=UPI003D6E5C5F